MFGNQRWVSKEISDEQIVRLCKLAGIPSLLAKVFLARGIDDIAYIQKFLQPSLEDLHPPFLMKGMEKAVERIVQAIYQKEKIIVYGDYDVDGITSTSILVDFLARQDADVDYYIPDRITEGYGFSMGAVDKIVKTGASLVVTVDCGITAVEEVEYSKKNKVDVIITDHHQCKEVVPEAYAVVNPCQPDCPYPFKELAGVGVVYKLLHALCLTMELGDQYHQYLDLVAIGTVADVVPLVEENRSIVKDGIERIKRSKNLGVQALLEQGGFRDKPVTSWGISFILAPRINAAGRLGDAQRAVRLFTTRDEEEAVCIAKELDEENKLRQDTELEIYKEALECVENRVDLDTEKVIVVAGDGWHHGVIGIVASKITEKYYRPCILLSNEEGVCKGSGRSIEGFNLFEALSSCEGFLDNYGGHSLAAGLSLKLDRVEDFRKKINQYADSILHEEDLIPKVKIDVLVEKKDVTMENVKKLEEMQPFGAGNPSPVFEYKNIEIAEIRTVGNDRHLKMKLKDGAYAIDAIGFQMGKWIHILSHTDKVDVAFSLEINSWNSTESVQMKLKELRWTRDVRMENSYFYSLDKCMAYCKNADTLMVENLENAIDDSTMMDRIQKDCRQGKRVAILANALDSVKRLDTLLKTSEIGIKNHYKICYTSSNTHDQSMVYLIVNPQPGKIDYNDFERIIFYDHWMDGNYLNELVKGINEEKTMFYKKTSRSAFNTGHIVPERSDLVAVYQYLKTQCKENQAMIEDLCILARKISKSYRIPMNYFKVKKSIEIFEELGLLKKREVGKYRMQIQVNANVNKKTSLEKSMLYQRLQSFKTGLERVGNKLWVQ